MWKFIILVILAIAAFWCYNNVDFSNITNNVSTSVKNEKTIKAVNSTRAVNYEAEQDVADNN